MPLNHTNKSLSLNINCDDQLLSTTLWAPKNNNIDVKDEQDKESYLKKYQNILKRKKMQDEAKNQMMKLYTQQNTSTLPFALKKQGNRKDGKKSSSSDNNSSGGEHSPIEVNGDNSSSDNYEEENKSKVNEIREDSRFFATKPFLNDKNHCITERPFNKKMFHFEPIKIMENSNNTPQQSRVFNNGYPISFPQRNLFPRNYGNFSPFENNNLFTQRTPSSSNGSANVTYSSGNIINTSTQTSSNHMMMNNYINSEPFDEDLREK